MWREAITKKLIGLERTQKEVEYFKIINSFIQI
jgi:hypothetical protein